MHVSMPAGAAPLGDARHGLKVTAYDRVRSLLVSLLILVGGAVMLMFLLWLTGVLTFSPQRIFVYPAERPATGPVNSGFANDLEEPGEEQLAELVEPQLEPTLADVTELVSTTAAQLDQLASEAADSSVGDGPGSDRREPGPNVDGTDVLPRWRRWEIQYNAGNIDAYARRLDHFQIELGAAGGGQTQVDYASNLADARPTTRQAPGDQDKRLYFSWKSGPLREFDRRLLAKANVSTRGRVLLQFIPKELEQQLAALERAYAGDRDLGEIRRTVFGVRQEGRDPAFYVVSMHFHADSTH